MNETMENKEMYVCKECGFEYEDDSTSLTTGKQWMETCEAWCKEHHSCNLEIISHGKPPREDKKS